MEFYENEIYASVLAVCLLFCLFQKSKQIKKTEDSVDRKNNPGRVSLVENIKDLSAETKR